MTVALIHLFKARLELHIRWFFDSCISYFFKLSERRKTKHFNGMAMLVLTYVNNTVLRDNIVR